MTTEAFQDVVEKLWVDQHERLWRSVYVWSGGSREVASEACAEAFAQLLRRGCDVRHPDAWVWRTAFRVAAGLLSEWRRREASQGATPHEDPDEAAFDLADLVAVREALAKLADDDRAVLVLSIVGGWSAADVGLQIGKTSTAVRVQRHRAKKRLYAVLEEQ